MLQRVSIGATVVTNPLELAAPPAFLTGTTTVDATPGAPGTWSAPNARRAAGDLHAAGSAQAIRARRRLRDPHDQRQLPRVRAPEPDGGTDVDGGGQRDVAGTLRRDAVARGRCDRRVDASRVRRRGAARRQRDHDRDHDPVRIVHRDHGKPGRADHLGGPGRRPALHGPVADRRAPGSTVRSVGHQRHADRDDDRAHTGYAVRRVDRSDDGRRAVRHAGRRQCRG